MEDQIISFETAVLAKEKGIIFKNLFSFNYTCYHKDGTIKNSDAFKTIEKIQSNIPTQSLLQKWLREVHDIFVSINTTSEFRWLSDDEGDQEYLPVHQFRVIKNKDNYKYDVIDWSSKYDIYEDALEKGLLQALKLIKNED